VIALAGDAVARPDAGNSRTYFEDPADVAVTGGPGEMGLATRLAAVRIAVDLSADADGSLLVLDEDAVVGKRTEFQRGDLDPADVGDGEVAHGEASKK